MYVHFNSGSRDQTWWTNATAIAESCKDARDLAVYLRNEPDIYITPSHDWVRQLTTLLHLMRPPAYRPKDGNQHDCTPSLCLYSGYFARQILQTMRIDFSTLLRPLLPTAAMAPLRCNQ
jgi:hypothetical protein